MCVCAEGEQLNEVHRLVVVELPTGKGEKGLVQQGKGWIQCVLCLLSLCRSVKLAWKCGFGKMGIFLVGCPDKVKGG